MRFNEFKLIEQDQKAGFYTVGDSHAVGLANYAGKPWISKARNGTRSTDPMHKAAIASIPKGSTVAISLGANDAQDIKANPQAVAANVAGVVNAAKQQGLKVHFILFPVGTKPNGEFRAKIREAIKAAIDVPVTDLEGSRLLDGVHADASAYKKAASSIVSASPLGPSSATPGNVPTKDKGQAAQPGSFSVDVPNSRRGPAVADVQKALVALGYPLPKHGVDGVRGPETVAAVKQFQQANNLTVDGDPGPETVAKLNAVLASKPEVAARLTKSTTSDVKAPTSSAAGGGKLPQLKMDAATTGKVGDLLNFIARYESAGDYNIMVGGKRGNLTKMTISEILDMQRNMIASGHESTAVGRYQYIRKTLANTVAQMGLDTNTKFDEKTQDAIATHTLRTIGLEKWLSGQLDDTTFLNKVAQIWASIPKSTGGSAHAGVGSNKAGLGANLALNTLQDIRTA